MAHFARLNETNEVIRVHVLNNEVITDGDGVEQEQLGIDFLTELHGAGNYVQTSYNDNFRKQYAGKGGSYDAAKDKFIGPQPYPSWFLDGYDDWKPPTARPEDDKIYSWDEEVGDWIEIS